MSWLSDRNADVVWRTLQVAAKQGSTFVIFLVAAKVLSPEDFGRYNYLLAIAFLLVIFSDFGISASSARFVTRYRVLGSDKYDLVLYNAAIVILGLATAIALGLVAYQGANPGADWHAWLILPLLYTIPLTSLYDGLYRGLGRFRDLSLVTMATGALSLAASFALTHAFGLTGALIALNAYYFLLLSGEAAVFPRSRYLWDPEVVREVGLYAGTVGVIWTAYFLCNRADQLVLGHYGYVTEVGYYELVNKWVMLLLMPAGILAQVEAPRIVALHAKGERDVILDKVRRAVMAVVGVTTPVAVVAVWVGPLLLGTFLPAMNVPLVVAILYVAMFLFPFQSLSEYVGNTFIVATGHAALNMWNVIFFGLLNVSLDVWFVSHLGPSGILYARMISVAGGSVALVGRYFWALRSESG